MKKLVFAISTLSMILVLSCKNSNNKSKSETNETDSAVSMIAQETPNNDDILTLGTTYVTEESFNGTDFMEGKVDLTMEFTVYGDESADCTIIETNNASSYGNNDSYTHKVEGTWSTVSKRNKRYVKIILSLEDPVQDYYKEFVYYIDKDHNLYANDINTHPTKLIEKSTSVSFSTTEDLSDYFGDIEGTDFEYCSFINAGNVYKLVLSIPFLDPDTHSCMYLYVDFNGVYMTFEGEIGDNHPINRWANTLTEMKELFIKNDKIARDNNVTTDITKDISDKYPFYGPMHLPDGGRTGIESKVLYKYIGGASSMELEVSNAFDSSNFHWVFSSVQDFDAFINAMDMTKINDAYQKHLVEYRAERQRQKEAEKLAREKVKQENALFD